MTLKLVSDNPEPQPARVPLLEYANTLRALADKIEAGDCGDVTHLATVIEYDGGLEICEAGERSSVHLLMGMFEAAKLMAFAEAMDD